MDSEQFIALFNQILDEKFYDFEKKIDIRFEKIDEKFNDFEKKIDIRFEKIDEKFYDFEKKINIRFDKIDERFEKIEKDIKNMQKEIKEIKDYINIEAKGIEHEIGDIIKNHYLTTRRGDVKFITFPIKKIHNNNDGNIITDFDYALIAFVKDEFYQIIIIEAKHYITFEKINNKIYQIYKLKELFNLIKTIPDIETKSDIYHKLFINDIILLKKFINFDKLESKILFYIGGPTLEHETDLYINEINTKDYDDNKYKHKFSSLIKKTSEEKIKEILQYLKGNIGYIIPKGNRYKIFDNSIMHELIGGTRYKSRFIRY